MNTRAYKIPYIIPAYYSGWRARSSRAASACSRLECLARLHVRIADRTARARARQQLGRRVLQQDVPARQLTQGIAFANDRTADGALQVDVEPSRRP